MSSAVLALSLPCFKMSPPVSFCFHAGAPGCSESSRDACLPQSHWFYSRPRSLYPAPAFDSQVSFINTAVFNFGLTCYYLFKLLWCFVASADSLSNTGRAFHYNSLTASFTLLSLWFSCFSVVVLFPFNVLSLQSLFTQDIVDESNDFIFLLFNPKKGLSLE